MANDPIVPLDDDRFPGSVVDLAGWKIRQGISKTRPFDQCKHRALVYDTTERRIFCEDCQRDIEAFTAFEAVAKNIGSVLAEADRIHNEARRARDHQLTSRAAKAVDEVWRGRKMVPCCPHCSAGLLPEDFVHGASAVGRDYELARRTRKGKMDDR